LTVVEVDGGRERLVRVGLPLAEEDGAAAVEDDAVGNAVAVQIDLEGGVARGDLVQRRGGGGTSGPGRVERNHAGNVAAAGGVGVGGDQVGPAVAVNVGRRHGVGLDSHGKTDLIGEGALAAVEEHAKGVVNRVGDDDVGFAVAIGVRDHHGVGRAAH